MLYNRLEIANAVQSERQGPNPVPIEVTEFPAPMHRHVPVSFSPAAAKTIATSCAATEQRINPTVAPRVIL